MKEINIVSPIFGEPGRSAQMLGKFSQVLLWLFVIDLGVALGAGLYEGRIVFSDWLVSSPDSGLHWNVEAVRRDNTGVRFWVFVTTVPLTFLTLANLISARRAVSPLRGWWLAAGIFALAERIFTFSYFIPTMVGLMAAPDSSESIATATQWANLNYVRHAIVLTALLLSLKAFSVFYQDSGRFKDRPAVSPVRSRD